MAAPVEKEALVKGGHMKSPARLLSTFTSSTLPCIYRDTIVLAATHPTVASAGIKDDGWFISDFYAFNYLLKGHGKEQTWLTAADPNRLVEKYGPYLHGNPYEERKVCLDDELLRQKKLTDVTVVRSSGMIERFISEAKRASELAKKTNAPLLLLVFCHGLPNHHLLLDDGERRKGLSILALKAVLEPAARITLVTTACFSGGWAVTPDLNTTALTAASHFPDLERGISIAWGVSASIGRSCGSIFASTMIETLSSATSPLLDAYELSDASNESTLQPDTPTEHQTLTYNAFCQSVLDTCQNSVTRLAEFQNFSFSAQNDDWEYSWTGRTGVPLAHFREQWAKLESYPYTGPADLRDNMNTDPHNIHFKTAGFSRTGGVRTEGDQSMLDTMTDHIAHRRLKEMAKTFHDTCPGDWNRSDHISLSSRLFRFYKGLDLEDMEMLEATIRFRWEAALLADYLLETFKLSKPGNEMCIMWHNGIWLKAIEKKIPEPEFSKRWLAIATTLEDAFDLPRLPLQGPPFGRPLSYLVAALIESDKPKYELAEICDAIKELMENVKAFQKQRMCEDREVRHRGREWLKSIGRQARRSLSPRKMRSTPGSVPA
ncbi:uncharacterized protein N7469_009043 [Penicillium citrinum]|uniref:Uncharacterized protein n=1 Tax=Penicillium citrinum TaxID=5077 RepID=A0A9W9NQ67_PENCI|nr:uncharacterized protein N7469_009043 [Penicillium citrinum]KAJ5222803.1 hypothetical protein N7469_009043 [Penicillium citrinum]